MQQKKMYKILSPIEKKGGGTYWMRLGTGYTNKDDSINVYLDAFPRPNSSSHCFELQIRELDEEDLRKRDSNRSSSSNDFGGIGGGPSSSHAASRAVTSFGANGGNSGNGANGNANADGDIPF
jgi:hypothetical protein